MKGCHAIKKIIALFALLLLCAGCSAAKEPVYVTASNTKSKIQVSEIDGLEFDWQIPEGESAPCCVITNSTDTDYFTGYATLEVYKSGEWMMAKNLPNRTIPEVAFDIPAHGVSAEIRAYLEAYGTAFAPGRYRAVLEIYEESEGVLPPNSKPIYAAEEFEVLL